MCCEGRGCGRVRGHARQGSSSKIKQVTSQRAMPPMAITRSTAVMRGMETRAMIVCTTRAGRSQSITSTRVHTALCNGEQTPGGTGVSHTLPRKQHMLTRCFVLMLVQHRNDGPTLKQHQILSCVYWMIREVDVNKEC